MADVVINVQLAPQQVDQILNALSVQPWKEVDGLIRYLADTARNQVQQQTQPPEEFYAKEPELLVEGKDQE